MYVCGIDPGFRGGLALLDVSGNLDDVIPMPVSGGEIDVKTVYDYVQQAQVAYIEKVNAYAGGSRSSAFSFGRNLEAVVAPCRLAGLTLRWVIPSRWKPAMLGHTGGTKEESVALAKSIYPSSRIGNHDGMAEAILIALYGIRYLNVAV